MAKMYITMIALHRAHELFVIYTFDHSVQNFLVSTLDISLLEESKLLPRRQYEFGVR